MRTAALFLALAGPALAGPPPPVTDAMYVETPEAEVALGRLLFWDPILSGNRNISCGTCHHPRFGTGDGVSLGLGEGGVGLGPDRVPDADNLPEQRIPRNAPALFNLGAREFTVLFHDGRIEADPTRASGLRTPLEDDMTLGFSGVLSAQTMFPVLSGDEMAGHYSENEISSAVRLGRITGEDGAWDLISARVAALPEYAVRFAEVYPEIADGREIAFTDISNAIAAFVAFEWRSDGSAFDAHLRGKAPLQGAAAEGMDLFYGKAGCGDCHSGAFQTDHDFHAMAAPQLGPGKAARFEDHARDVGRMRVTGDPADAYAFRTPSLRNVTATGPWGHAGAHSDLRAFVVDHLDPARALERWERAAAMLPAFEAEDWRVADDQAERAAIAGAVTRPAVHLSDAEVDALIAFLHALDDEQALRGRLGIPDTVPSGLRVDH
ncbi:cytochrome-c peroxidase [Halovulum sp. GXIMD14794]